MRGKKKGRKNNPKQMQKQGEAALSRAAWGELLTLRLICSPRLLRLFALLKGCTRLRVPGPGEQGIWADPGSSRGCFVSGQPRISKKGALCLLGEGGGAASLPGEHHVLLGRKIHALSILMLCLNSKSSQEGEKVTGKRTRGSLPLHWPRFS